MAIVAAYNSHLYLLLSAACVSDKNKVEGLSKLIINGVFLGKEGTLLTFWSRLGVRHDKRSNMAVGIILSVVMSLALFLPASSSLADPLSEIQRTGSNKVAEGKASQERVNRLSATTQSQLREYRLLQKQIEGLETYNKQLGKQIQNQQELIKKYEASISEVASIERQMSPLVVKMVKSLSDFIELDMPFHMTERRERLSQMDENLVAADINVAEKFRQIIEAYQIENEYGRKVDSYQDIAVIEGVGYEVDVLRVGRIALVSQTKDTTITAAWDNNTKSWQRLDNSVYRNAVREGLKMANKQAPIGMLVLPISATGRAY